MCDTVIHISFLLYFFRISSHSSFVDNERDKSNLCQLLHIRVGKITT